MLIQLLGAFAYTFLAIIVLLLWGSYKPTVRNIAAFVVSGGIGFMGIVLVGNLFADNDGQLTSGIQVYIYLAFLAVGLFGGSYLGVRLFGSKAHGT